MQCRACASSPPVSLLEQLRYPPGDCSTPLRRLRRMDPGVGPNSSSSSSSPASSPDSPCCKLAPPARLRRNELACGDHISPLRALATGLSGSAAAAAAASGAAATGSVWVAVGEVGRSLLLLGGRLGGGDIAAASASDGECCCSWVSGPS